MLEHVYEMCKKYDVDSVRLYVCLFVIHLHLQTRTSEQQRCDGVLSAAEFPCY